MQLARIDRVCRQQRKFQKIKLNIAFLQEFLPWCPGRCISRERLTADYGALWGIWHFHSCHSTGDTTPIPDLFSQENSPGTRGACIRCTGLPARAKNTMIFGLKKLFSFPLSLEEKRASLFLFIEHRIPQEHRETPQSTHTSGNAVRTGTAPQSRKQWKARRSCPDDGGPC